MAAEAVDDCLRALSEAASPGCTGAVRLAKLITGVLFQSSTKSKRRNGEAPTLGAQGNQEKQGFGLTSKNDGEGRRRARKCKAEARAQQGAGTAESHRRSSGCHQPLKLRFADRAR